MKKHLAFLLCAALVLPLALSGCGGETYYIYSNIPASELKIDAGNFRTAEELSPSEYVHGQPETAPAGYTSRAAEFYAMSANAVLVVSADFSDAAVTAEYEGLKSEVAELLASLDKSLSATDENSVVSKFNAAEAGERVETDGHFNEVLTVAKQMHAFTEGSYNPAVYDGVRAFGFLGADRPESVKDLPSNEKCAVTARVASHFNEVQLIAENGAYYAVKPEYKEVFEGAEYNLKLDLGGIGKGYAADLIDGLLSKHGFKFGYFNFASSSMACKNSAGSGNYTVGLKNPRANRGNYVRVDINNAKLSTGGDYSLYYILDGKRYCSIISPETGKPVETEVITATVIGGSAAEADALTTAIIAMGREKAQRFTSEKLKDRLVIFVCEKV